MPALFLIIIMKLLQILREKINDYHFLRQAKQNLSQPIRSEIAKMHELTKI